MRERWGTFSVRDHMMEAPFVSDVLLYDRLVIPVPPANRSEDDFWLAFQPERQQSCLNLLKVKTKDQDGLAFAVPWDSSKRERFQNRMSAASALETQHRAPQQGYYLDPFEMTRELIKDEFFPALPLGVSKAWAVAAYSSADAFRRELAAADPDRRRRQLAVCITHRFLTPAKSDPNQELLKKAVELATKDDFRRKRGLFYEWQERIIEEDISDTKAVEELEQLLKAYNKSIKDAFRNAITKFVFTVIPIAVTMTGALIAGTTAGLLVSGTGGLVQMARFWKFDRKPVIGSDDLNGAAMIHDARKELSLD